MAWRLLAVSPCHLLGLLQGFGLEAVQVRPYLALAPSRHHLVDGWRT